MNNILQPPKNAIPLTMIFVFIRIHQHSPAAGPQQFPLRDSCSWMLLVPIIAKSCSLLLSGAGLYPFLGW